MKGKIKTYIIKDIYDMMKHGRLIVPPFQRNYYWDKEQQTLFINSILKGYYIGQMILAKSQESESFDIIDGQQRLKTIFYFIENGFKLEDGKIELDLITQQNFLNQPIYFYIIDELSESEDITDVFRLINTNVEPLNMQEIRRINKQGFFAKLVSEYAIELFPQKEKLSSNDENSKKIFMSSIWHRLNVFTKKELLKMEDEILIARIILSILYDRYLQYNDSLLDEAYNENSSSYAEIRHKLTEPSSTIISNIKSIFSILNNTSFEVECLSKEGFYITFLSIYNIVINEQSSIENSNKLIETFNEINSLVPTRKNYKKQYVSLSKYAKDLIVKNCFENGEPENVRLLKDILVNAKIETAKYEFKQGILRLSNDRKKDTDMQNRLLETICAMANMSFSKPAYLLIGVADKEKDAKRIEYLDKIIPLKYAEHYVVGIEREAEIMNISVDQYCIQLKVFIDSSELSNDLKLAVLSNINLIDYNGRSVVCIEIPRQKGLSLLGKKAFIRKHSSTVEVTNPKEIESICKKIFSHQ